MSRTEQVKKTVKHAGMIVDDSFGRYDSIRQYVEFERTCSICGKVGIRKCKPVEIQGETKRLCHKCFKTHRKGGIT